MDVGVNTDSFSNTDDKNIVTAALESQLTHSTRQLNEVLQEKYALEARLQNTSSENDTALKNISDMQVKINALTFEASERNKEQAIMAEENRNFAKTNQELIMSVESLRSDNSDLSCERDKLSSEISLLRTKLSSVESHLTEMSYANEKCSSDNKELESSLKHISQENQKLIVAAENLRNENSELDCKRSILSSDINAIRSRLAAAESSLADVSSDNENLTSERDELEAALKQTTIDRDAALTRISYLQEKLDGHIIEKQNFQENTDKLANELLQENQQLWTQKKDLECKYYELFSLHKSASTEFEEVTRKIQLIQSHLELMTVAKDNATAATEHLNAEKMQWETKMDEIISKNQQLHYEIDYLLAENKLIKEQAEFMSKDKSDIEAEMVELSAKISSLGSIVSNRTLERDELTLTVAGLKSKLMTNESDIKKLLEEKKSFDSDKRMLVEMISVLQNKKDADVSQSDVLTSDLNSTHQLSKYEASNDEIINNIVLQIKKVEKEIIESSLEKERLHVEKNETEAKLNQVTDELGALSANRDTEFEKMKELLVEVDASHLQITKLTEGINSYKSQNTELSEKIAFYLDEINDWKQSLQSAEVKLERCIKEKQETLNMLNDLRQKGDNAAAEYETSLQEISEQLSQSLGERKEVQQETLLGKQESAEIQSSMQKQLIRNQDEVSACKKKIVSLNETIQNLTNDLTCTKTELTRALEMKETHLEERDSAKRQIEEMKSELESLLNSSSCSDIFIEKLQAKQLVASHQVKNELSLKLSNATNSLHQKDEEIAELRKKIQANTETKGWQNTIPTKEKGLANDKMVKENKSLRLELQHQSAIMMDLEKQLDVMKMELQEKENIIAITKEKHKKIHIDPYSDEAIGAKTILSVDKSRASEGVDRKETTNNIDYFQSQIKALTSEVHYLKKLLTEAKHISEEAKKEALEKGMRLMKNEQQLNETLQLVSEGKQEINFQKQQIQWKSTHLAEMQEKFAKSEEDLSDLKMVLEKEQQRGKEFEKQCCLYEQAMTALQSEYDSLIHQNANVANEYENSLQESSEQLAQAQARLKDAQQEILLTNQENAKMHSSTQNQILIDEDEISMYKEKIASLNEILQNLKAELENALEMKGTLLEERDSIKMLIDDMRSKSQAQFAKYQEEYSNLKIVVEKLTFDKNKLFEQMQTIERKCGNMVTKIIQRNPSMQDSPSTENDVEREHLGQGVETNVSRLKEILGKLLKEHDFLKATFRQREVTNSDDDDVEMAIKSLTDMASNRGLLGHPSQEAMLVREERKTQEMHAGVMDSGMENMLQSNHTGATEASYKTEELEGLVSNLKIENRQLKSVLDSSERNHPIHIHRNSDVQTANDRARRAEEVAAALAVRAKRSIEKRNAEILSLQLALSSLSDVKDSEIASLKAKLSASEKSQRMAEDTACAISQRAHANSLFEKKLEDRVQITENETLKVKNENDALKKKVRKYKSKAFERSRQLFDIDRCIKGSAHAKLPEISLSDSTTQSE
eukprot:CAMPEP_0172480118 /NCGR_PEP_ID=MMETSP1066-20121228/5056_1 /TAXON_ID=671091 /ORGANISM="Coscinodiscus wailesii, Strain CCMP2513" /LENGTH=1507 /DNA_ID=CAMNT_0013241143 /DNA_START=77 /DNA_END=4600 /DNA_ORIENTATION=+